MEFYLTVGATLISSLIFFVIGIFKNSFYNIPFKWFFILYVFLSFTQSLISLLARSGYNNLYDSNFIEISINVFTLFEIILFTAFFLKVISDNNFQKIIALLVTPFIIWILYRWIFFYEYSIINKYITVIECAIFIIISLLYFIKVLKSPIEVKLNQNPTLWIVIGIFFLCIFLFPFYLFKDDIYQLFTTTYDTFFTIINIGYTVFFLCLLKSIQCQLNIK